MIILLDNGHGCDTPGKRSPVWGNGKQLFEWEFNRDVVQRTHNLLLGSGHTPVILVPEKTDITLTERCKRANDIYLKNKGQVILVSIHANAGVWYRDWETDRKSTRLNSSHSAKSRMPSSA